MTDNPALNAVIPSKDNKPGGIVGIRFDLDYAQQHLGIFIIYTQK